MSPEAEELLRELISKMDSAGHVFCTNTQSIAFHELNESSMLSKVNLYKSGGGYVELSTKAIHYFEEKEAEQKRLEEQRLNEKKAEQSKLLHDVLLVVLGAVLAFLFQLLASAIFPRA
ncbi:MAG: hypothetical protein ACFNX8_00930 [Lancefieldella rimae]